jgi:hypothetical protein
MGSPSLDGSTESTFSRLAIDQTTLAEGCKVAWNMKGDLGVCLQKSSALIFGVAFISYLLLLNFGISKAAGYRHVHDNSITAPGTSQPMAQSTYRFTYCQSAYDATFSKYMEALDRYGHTELVMPTPNHQQSLPGGTMHRVGCMYNPPTLQGHLWLYRSYRR